MDLQVECIVICTLEEGEGLSFLWFSEFQELEKNDKGELEPEDEDELFKTLISPLCDQIFYCYYGDEDADSDDIKEWEILEDLDENIESGKYRIPDFIKIVFKWPGEDLERTITLPIRKLSQVELWRSRCEKKKKKWFHFSLCTGVDCAPFRFVYEINGGNHAGTQACQPISSKG